MNLLSFPPPSVTWIQTKWEGKTPPSLGDQGEGSFNLGAASLPLPPLFIWANPIWVPDVPETYGLPPRRLLPNPSKQALFRILFFPRPVFELFEGSAAQLRGNLEFSLSLLVDSEKITFEPQLPRLDAQTFLGSLCGLTVGRFPQTYFLWSGLEVDGFLMQTALWPYLFKKNNNQDCLFIMRTLWVSCLISANIEKIFLEDTKLWSVSQKM